jgi:hypothetical protein
MLTFLAGLLTGFVGGFVALVSIGRALRRHKTAQQETPAEALRRYEAGVHAAKWTVRGSWGNRPWPEA